MQELTREKAIKKISENCSQTSNKETFFLLIERTRALNIYN